MDLNYYIQELKPLILGQIKQQCEDLIDDSLPHSSTIAEQLYEYTSRGKLLRGIFVVLAAESFGRLRDRDILDIASAIELAQTALLIHDDIMDQDDLRRNKASMHKIYQNQGFDKHTSLSLAMCVGDLALFHIFRYLDKDLVGLFARELSKTVLGQVYDVEKSFYRDYEISQEEFLLIIQHKTTNYTFSLPFQAGLTLAKASKESIELVKELSIPLGLIFQIRDDELNYFPKSQIGKSSGGDIRENKKTFCRSLLIEKCPQAKALYGQEDQIEQIKLLYQQAGIKEILSEQLQSYRQCAEGIINRMSMKKEYHQLWHELLEYLMQRKF
ncbi:MAG: polyprenyl synthetase family protein [Brevinema sp.]